jgi:bifunctional UDP-N-acetylglucosamine pyrophosphorylase / glucosamine-1-phosphate N-acetyltransferase
VKQQRQASVKNSNQANYFISEEVDDSRISGDDVTIHPGCRITGSSTLICKGAILGEEGPVTIENCQVGPGVRLKGGYFRNAVFLKGASMGSGAHVREGTILEEGASGAHTVGLKQTILFPYVTLGSLINFCDCLMAGGTGKKNHSEVGSSYVHFNFTPNQDKATASLIGDVPRGVMLNQAPIFLGGQGGLVGPSRLSYGTVIAAGSIYRKDELRPNRLISDAGGRAVNIPYEAGFYRSIKRIVRNNILYIANLTALQQWYIHVRAQFVSEDFPEPLLNGLHEKVEMAISERLKKLGGFADKMLESIRIYRELVQEKASDKLIRQKTELYEKYQEVEALISSGAGEGGLVETRDAFLEAVSRDIQASGNDYPTVIKGLNRDDQALGSRWLQGIVDGVSRRAFELLPSLGLLE